MPIEVMAERGEDTLRYGPMKPVGLDDPRTGRWPYAVVQLRQDNALGTLWNMVGFQTKLKHAEQVRLFRTIPGLENAEFARLGGLHRNTFINSPQLLDGDAAARRPRRTSASPARSPAAKAMSNWPRSACSPAASPRRSCSGEALAPPPLDHRARRPARPHHRRRRRRELPADERQFRPVPADRGPDEEGRPQEALHRAREGRPWRVAGCAQPSRLQRLLPRRRSRPRRGRRIFGRGSGLPSRLRVGARRTWSRVRTAHSSKDSRPSRLVSSRWNGRWRGIEQFRERDPAVIVAVGAVEAALLLGALVGRGRTARRAGRGRTPPPACRRRVGHGIVLVLGHARSR